MLNSRSGSLNAIRTDASNPFAHDTMLRRLPSFIDAVLEVNPDYSPLVVDSLRRLKAEVLEDRPICSIVPPAPDWGGWEEQFLRHHGESWLHSEWFFAENMYYRRIIESVRWWETGRDPFAPIKAQEYAGSAHRSLLRTALAALEAASSPAERLSTQLLADMWGNRIDLSHSESASLGAATPGADDLLVDDRQRIVELLLDGGVGQADARSVHIVTDNAGSELTMDLLLADLLVSLGFTVYLDVKMHPTYVSDTTAPDILSFLRLLCGGREGKGPAQLGERLQGAFDRGALRIVPDLYWNSSRFIGELPPRLLEPFRAARLVIFKGDVNYRRASRDIVWPYEAGFAEVVGSFPVPMALLRTMKSDTLFGFSTERAERLDAEDPDWRTNGRRGVIQLFG